MVFSEKFINYNIYVDVYMYAFNIQLHRYIYAKYIPIYGANIIFIIVVIIRNVTKVCKFVCVWVHILI